MAIKWNEDQTKVIQSVDADTLVSASAGSGKTSVMIERVVRLIKSGVPIGSIVMLTFSNAVAAELRERIAAALMKAMREDGANKEELRRQIDGIAMADIGTVHSFCGNLIKEFSEQAGVDPSYSIVTDDEKSGLIDRAIAEVFASYGESADEDIEALRLYFGGERKFAAAIVRALNYVAAQPDRDDSALTREIWAATAPLSKVATPYCRLRISPISARRSPPFPPTSSSSPSATQSSKATAPTSRSASLAASASRTIPLSRRKSACCCRVAKANGALAAKTRAVTPSNSSRRCAASLRAMTD